MTINFNQNILLFLININTLKLKEFLYYIFINFFYGSFMNHEMRHTNTITFIVDFLWVMKWNAIEWDMENERALLMLYIHLLILENNNLCENYNKIKFLEKVSLFKLNGIYKIIISLYFFRV